MFHYTDDAIVTSSPTGRHLSTVIRRPAAIGPLDWTEHADQVCKVLNELKAGDKAHSLSLHMQWCGRVYRPLPDVPAELRAEHWRPSGWPASGDAYAYDEPERRIGPSFAELIDQGYLSPLSFGAVPPAGPTPAATEPTPATARITELEKYIWSLETECSNARDRLRETEKQLDDATTKLCAAQVLLEKPIEVSNDLAQILQKGWPGQTFLANRTFKRVE